MSWLTSLQFALAALGKHRARAALTAIGVVVGVASVIAMLGIGAGSQQRVAEELEKMGTNHLVVRAGSATRSGVRDWAGTATRLNVGDADAIRELPGIITLSPIVQKLDRVRYRGTNWATQIQGVSPEYLSARSWPLDEGEFFNDWHVEHAAQVCVLGQTVAFELFGLRSPLGETMLVKEMACRVTGILAKKGASSWGSDQDDLVLMPYTTLQRKLLGKTHVNRILIQTADQSTALRLREDIRSLMRQRHRLETYQEDDFRIHSRADLAQASEETARVFTWLLASMATVCLVVGGIGVMNIMLVSVTERTREIGIRMALGARRRDVLTQHLIEALLLSCAGGAVGIIVGVGSALAIGQLSDLPVFITPWSVALAFLFSALVGIVFGLYPAQKAAGLRPAEALRHE